VMDMFHSKIINITVSHIPSFKNVFFNTYS
jgi:hypothetical protein